MSDRMQILRTALEHLKAGRFDQIIGETEFIPLPE